MLAVFKIKKLFSLLKNKKVQGILQLILGVVLLIFIVLVSRADLNEISQIFAELNWPWYLVAFALFLLNTAIRAYRWSVLIGALDERVPFGRLLRLYFISLFFNNFLPSGFGGDVVKVLGLRQESGRGPEALSSVVMDRLTGLLGSSLVALLGLLWHSLHPTVSLDLPRHLIAVIVLVSLGIPLGFLFLRWSEPLPRLAAWFPWSRPITQYGRLVRLAATIRRYPYPALLQSLLISLPFTFSLVLAQYCIARALSADVPFALFALFVPIISLITLLPVSFNGLGTREGAYLLLFVPAGVRDEKALAMSFAFFFLRFATGLIGGLLYALQSAGSAARAASYTNQ
jgi:uncharacterized membrane protein YbhN (UPF0104 family)